MRRWITTIAAFAAALSASAEAMAHGGQYAPPFSAGPPNPARKLTDVPPPPPERTPEDVFGPATPGGGGTANVETPGIRDAAHWTRWWYANRAVYVGEALHPALTGNGASEVRKAAIDALSAVLEDPNPDLASGACVALGRIGDAASAPLLVARLRDRAAHATVREAAALGLGLLPRDTAAAGAALTSVAMSGTEPVRLKSMAVYALGIRRDYASFAVLRDLAADDDSPLDLACAARTALGLAGGDTERAALDSRLVAPGKSDADAFLRAYAAHGLSRLGDDRAAPALRRAAKDHDAHVRSAALLGLGALAACDDGTARLLASALRDTDAACRNAAAISLGRSGHKLARAALEEALRAKDGGLRCHAALGLGLLARKTGDPLGAGAVALLLKDRSDRDLRGAVAVALGLAKLTASAAELRDVAGDDTAGEPRAYAAVALGMIGDTAAVPVLRGLVRNSSVPLLPWEAATALGLLGDAAAIADLRAVFTESQSIYVQGNAAIGLGRVGGPAAAELLVSLVRDEARSGMVRGLAAVGLGLALVGSSRGYGAVATDLPWGIVTPTVAEIVSIL